MREQPHRQFDCELCGALDDGGGIGGWDVNTQLWNEVMLAHGAPMGQFSAKGMLCINCFEKRLGRKLVASDFSDTLRCGSNKTNSNVQKILMA